MTLKGKRILFFAAPLYEDLELWYPKIRLEEEGASTTVAGMGEKTYPGKRGYPVTVDTNVDQVDASNFDALVIPGGFRRHHIAGVRHGKHLLHLGGIQEHRHGRTAALNHAECLGTVRNVADDRR